MAKGVSKIYVPDTLTKGTMFISHLRTRAKRENTPLAEIFEVYLPEHGVVELTCEEPFKIPARPKAKTAIKLTDPFITVRNRVSGGDGNKRARVLYNLNATGFEIEGGTK